MRSMGRGLVGILIAFAATVASAQVNVVTVTNTSNIVNGDTIHMNALKTAPGMDGISFREAILAAAGTDGPKLINFAPGLTGQRIEIGSQAADNYQPMVLVSGDLYIDGDIDDDEIPDVTISAQTSLAGTPFIVRSSNNTIDGLGLDDFRGPAIQFACLDRSCNPRAIGNTKILNNVITSQRGSGIIVSGVGALPLQDHPFIGEMQFEDLTITGNTIIARDGGIAIKPGVQGTSRNVALRITIARNKIINGTVGIEVSAGDLALPPNHSDSNLVESVTIDDNQITASEIAIKVFAANYGNSDNAVNGLRIRKNRIAESKIAGIVVTAAENGRTQRSTARNVVTDVTIAENAINGGPAGILVSAADVPIAETDALAFESNRIDTIAITANTITEYTTVGIRVWGALANAAASSINASSNTVSKLSIRDNTVTAAASSQSVGIEVIGGESRGNGNATRNSISAAITGNRVSSNAIGISIVAGRGAGARSNQVFVSELSNNVVTGNATGLLLSENVNGASGNLTLFSGSRRRAVKR